LSPVYAFPSMFNSTNCFATPGKPFGLSVLRRSRKMCEGYTDQNGMRILEQSELYERMVKLSLMWSYSEKNFSIESAFRSSLRGWNTTSAVKRCCMKTWQSRVIK